MQETFDWLYERSAYNCTKGIDLYEIITSENNILLAYRMIKSNTGSKTQGVDKSTIDDFKIKDKYEFIEDIRKSLRAYESSPIRRVMILKPNGGERPLGIPTMKDRLIQQMFKQVLEPICEAKFYKHSYGFRPNRSTEHALARCNFVTHGCSCHYVVDVDIKGFFDNVNHSKLLKQLYNIGVKDKRVLAIIYKMLQAPILSIGNPTKGTPQGGILSPLLSNVVLNDLDWWIANQWETFKTNNKYSRWNKYRALKPTKLKEMHIVRYADDFKIYTTDHKSANKIFHATKGYIENNLHLEISKEKSRITNLRKRYSEFLGFELKVQKQKKHKYMSISRISSKSKARIKNEVKKKIKVIQKNPTHVNINQYNLYVRGIQNYYRVATRVNLDFADIYFSCLPAMYNRFKSIGEYEKPRSPPITYQKLYRTTARAFKVNGIYLFPLNQVKWRILTFFKPQISNYTKQGRQLKIKQLKPNVANEIYKLNLEKFTSVTLEYSDNRISRYSMQNGKCAVTGVFLIAEMVHCHHIKPKKNEGTDKFDNLVIVQEWVHKLIHATQVETIDKYMRLLQLEGKQLEELNKYRKKCNLTEI